MIAPADWFVATDDLDPILRRIVGRKVRAVIRSGSVAPQDAADFEQELYVRLLASATVFDPGRSHQYGFATVVVDRAASKLLRDRRAQKRDPARVQRLSSDVAVEHGEFTQAELAMDVANVMAQLPAGQRLLAERLTLSGVSQIAREDQVSRKAVYRLVREIRDRFKKAGFVGSGRTEDGHHN